MEGMGLKWMETSRWWRGDQGICICLSSICLFIYIRKIIVSGCMHLSKCLCIYVSIHLPLYTVSLFFIQLPAKLSLSPHNFPPLINQQPWVPSRCSSVIIQTIFLSFISVCFQWGAFQLFFRQSFLHIFPYSSTPLSPSLVCFYRDGFHLIFLLYFSSFCICVLLVRWFSNFSAANLSFIYFPYSSSYLSSFYTSALPRWF